MVSLARLSLNSCLVTLTVDCEWKTVEVGECLPDCAGGGVIERYYVITQQPDNGGRPCPKYVLDNVTEVEECCRK